MSFAARSPGDHFGAASARAAAPCAPGSEKWILAATILGSSMVFVDGTVVNVAVPALQRSLGATIFQSQWVIESYALLLATLLLVGGAAGDRYGRKRVFAIGVAVFALASAWCAAARGIDELIAARALQGAGGALLTPGSLAILGASFAQAQRGRAIGIWSGYTAIAAAIGPIAGGWLIDHLSWRYAFIVNLPLAATVLAITWRHVPESRDPDAPPRLDWPGAVLATAGLGGLVFGLIEAPERGWTDTLVITAYVLGAAALIAFVAIERRSRHPLLPLKLFRSRNFSGANLLTLLLYAALGGGLFFLPLNLIQVQGYSTTAAGAALLPFVLLMFSLSGWAGGLADRHGPRRPLVVGPAIAALGFALLAVPGAVGSYWTSVLPGVLVMGFGMSLCVAPLTTTVMNSVETAMAGTASGTNNTVSRVAALLAIALFGMVMNHAFARALEQRLETVKAPESVKEQVYAQRARLGAIEIPKADASVRGEVREALDASFIEGYRWVMGLAALLALAAAVSAWVMIEDRARSESR